MSQRSQIKVIEVSMRKQDEIDPGQFMEGKGGRREAFRPNGEKRQPHPDAREEDRVGQDCDAEEIEQDRSMSEPGGR